VIRRVFLFATAAAVLVVAAGIATWYGHAASLASRLDAQLATANALLRTAPVRNDPASLLELLGSPEINVMVRDESDGNVYNYVDGAATGPPPPARPAGPPPFAPGGPPGAPPEMAPPPGPGGGAPRPARTSLAVVIASLARIPPRQTRDGDLSLVLVPSAGALARWFAGDVAVCALAILALGAAAWTAAGALARAAYEPLRRTTGALEELARGNFTPQTIEAGDSPEIARLARAYNAAAETVARSIAERRAAADEFQRFLADAGHELRTPLTIVGGYVDILGRGMRDDDATGRRVIAGMTAETGRMRALVEKMLLLSRLESAVSAPRVVEVGPVCDEDDLYEAGRNLVENALRYAPGSPVEVRAVARDGFVCIEVADRGTGIPFQEQTMIFERFYRGKDHTDSQGSGLGLAIVRRVVERWGGTISLNSDAGGTSFVMRFPIAQRA
jgi:two-component system OmpR family sensor kinase